MPITPQRPLARGRGLGSQARVHAMRGCTGPDSFASSLPGLIETPKQRFEIRTANRQILDRLAHQKIEQTADGTLEAASPQRRFTSGQPEESRRSQTEAARLVLPPNGNLVSSALAQFCKAIIRD